MKLYRGKRDQKTPGTQGQHSMIQGIQNSLLAKVKCKPKYRDLEKITKAHPNLQEMKSQESKIKRSSSKDSSTMTYHRPI